MFAKTACLTTAMTLGASAALALTDATATTDLNLRAAPGPVAEILTVIPGQSRVEVALCAADSEWCEVTFQGTRGWAFGPYLTAALDQGPKPVSLYENLSRLEIEKVDTPAPAFGLSPSSLSASSLSDTAEEIAAALAGGPAALTTGVLLGSLAGTPAVPQEIVTYVADHPVPPVLIEAEVTPGLTLPGQIALTHVPGTAYRYADVNGNRVLVDGDRQVLHVIR